MKMYVSKSWVKSLDNGTYLNISICPDMWTTTIHFDIWEEGNGRALVVSQKTFLNFDKFLPMKLARKLAKWSVNKQTQKIAGIDLIT